MKKKQRYNHAETSKLLLEKASDEQLRVMRIRIAKELESRLAKAESKYFKNPAIGAKHPVPAIGGEYKKSWWVE